MSEEHDGREKACGDDAVSACGPDESESNGGEAKGQVVVHEAHVEDVAVGQHGDERADYPGSVAGGGAGEGEGAPEKNEDAEGDGNFFCGVEADDFGEVVEHQV